jgi:pimeloyl-ACP methyl ester carboxylesterase
MRIVMLPGLGADMRLFTPQLETFEDSLVPAWVDHRAGGGETLAHYAERMLASMVESGVVPGREGAGRAGGSWGLVGFSFGGQVALEIAKIMAAGASDAARAAAPLRAVVLISSHRTSETIDAEFKRNVRYGTKLPGFVIRIGMRIVAGRFAKANKLNASQARSLQEMAIDADTDELKAAARAAAAWSFDKQDIDAITGAGIVLRQVHGSRDDIIPPPTIPVDDEIDGPHLLTWTHPKRVNAFIADALGLAHTA